MSSITQRTASCSCGQLTAVVSGEPIRVSICHCLATVHYSNAGREEFVVIPVGAFADPTFPPPTFSVYEERKHAWVGLPEDIEHMA